MKNCAQFSLMLRMLFGNGRYSEVIMSTVASQIVSLTIVYSTVYDVVFLSAASLMISLSCSYIRHMAITPLLMC